MLLWFFISFTSCRHPWKSSSETINCAIVSLHQFLVAILECPGFVHFSVLRCFQWQRGDYFETDITPHHICFIHIDVRVWGDACLLFLVWATGIIHVNRHNDFLSIILGILFSSWLHLTATSPVLCQLDVKLRCITMSHQASIPMMDTSSLASIAQFPGWVPLNRLDNSNLLWCRPFILDVFHHCCTPPAQSRVIWMWSCIATQYYFDSSSALLLAITRWISWRRQ